jgi:L-aspartate oxidase
MLECLVFGRRAAQDINERTADLRAPQFAAPQIRHAPDFDHSSLRREIQALMSEYCYVIRTPRGMEYALGRVRELKSALEHAFSSDLAYLEALNVATIAAAILAAALARPESIGSHCVEADL